jgi:glycosyltransferase involved in cell wall biosynthesis
MDKSSTTGAPELVSIVIPCHNDGDFLSASLDSALQQTYRHKEVIVVDDASDDPRTLRLLKRIEHPDVRILHVDKRHPGAARNAGIQSARGCYILPLDADDLIEPTYVEKAACVLMSRPDVGIVYCKAVFIGKKTGPWELPPFNIGDMLANNLIFVTALFRKSDWCAVGGFRERQFRLGLEDYDFWLALLGRGRQVHQIQESLFRYRVKASSRTTRLYSNLEDMIEAHEQLYQNHRHLYEQHSGDYIKSLRKLLLVEMDARMRLQEIVDANRRSRGMPQIRSIIGRLVGAARESAGK